MRAPSQVLGPDVVTIVRAPLSSAADRYGRQVRDWTLATRTPIAGCAVQQFTTDETLVDRDFTMSRLHVFMPAGADVTPVASDRLEWNGGTYEVDGEPFAWTDDTGQADHIEFYVKRWTG